MLHGNAVAAFLFVSAALPGFWREDRQLQKPAN